MSQRRPSSPSATRRDVFRALALAPAAAMVGCKGKDDGGTPSPLPTGDTGVVTLPRAEAPTSPWGGAAPVDAVRFPLGSQAGEALPDGFVAWTYAPGDVSVEIHVARWDGSAWVDETVESGTPTAEGYLHLELSGLVPDTHYAIQAVAGGVGSSVAHLTTAPDPEAYVEVRLGGISCNDQEHGEFTALEELQTLGPLDAMLWLGDFLYADACETEEEYRALWQEQLAKRSLQSIFGFAGSVYSWDDHEVDNNWDPQTFDPARLQVALKTFFETVPLPASVRNSAKMWRKLRYGRTVELFVLDVRSERDRAAGEYISPEQLAWLKQGLTDSPCVWKVVATSVPITDWPLAWDAALAHLDRWDGFEGTQRQELLDHIVGSELRGVFFVSGDLHQTTLSYVDPAGGTGEKLLEFLVGPGGSTLNVVARLLDDPQFPYADADWSAGRMVFRPDGTARLQTIHESGAMMMEAVVDIDGNVTFELEAHPWDDD